MRLRQGILTVIHLVPHHQKSIAHLGHTAIYVYLLLPFW